MGSFINNVFVIMELLMPKCYTMRESDSYGWAKITDVDSQIGLLFYCVILDKHQLS
jgi:hypothetical protein